MFCKNFEATKIISVNKNVKLTRRTENLWTCNDWLRIRWINFYSYSAPALYRQRKSNWAPQSKQGGKVARKNSRVRRNLVQIQTPGGYHLLRPFGVKLEIQRERIKPYRVCELQGEQQSSHNIDGDNPIIKIWKYVWHNMYIDTCYCAINWVIIHLNRPKCPVMGL